MQINLSPLRTPFMALVGGSASGKDTFATTLTMLLAQERGTVVQKLALADPFKRFLREVTPATTEQLWGPSHKREEVVAGLERCSRVMEQQSAGTVSSRELCQFFDQMRDFDTDIWVAKALDTLRQLDRNPTSFLYTAERGIRPTSTQDAKLGVLMVTDVRRPNEARALRMAGARLVRVRALHDQERAAPDKRTSHLSEWEVTEIPPEWFDDTVTMDLRFGQFSTTLSTVRTYMHTTLLPRLDRGSWPATP